jgi:hypothetical protein
VTAIGTKVTIIHNTFNLLMNQTSSKDGVNPMTIQSVTDDEIATRMVAEYVDTVFARNVRLKTLGLKVKE